MRAKLALFVAGILLAVGAGVLAQTSGGGFPSRPRLQSLGVGVAAPAGSGNAAINGTLTGATNLPTLGGNNVFTKTGQSAQSIRSSTSGTTDYAELNLQNGAGRGLYADISSSAYSGSLFPSAPAGEVAVIGIAGAGAGAVPLCFMTNSVANRLCIDGGGNVTMGGAPVYKHAAAYVTGAGASSVGPYGLTSSKTSTGFYALNLTSSGFTQTPVCVASGGTSGNIVVNAGASTSTSATVTTYVSGVLTDSAFSVTCTGP